MGIVRSGTIPVTLSGPIYFPNGFLEHVSDRQCGSDGLLSMAAVNFEEA